MRRGFVAAIASAKTVHASCDIPGSGVDEIWASVPGSVLKFVYWSEEHHVDSAWEDLPSDRTALAARLAGRG